MQPKIHDWAKIINQQNLLVGDFSQIDDFVLINAGEETTIGRFVHIASFVSIIGGGKMYMGDFTILSAGCRVMTAVDDFAGPYLSGVVPKSYSNVKRSMVYIEQHALIGTNSIIFPGVNIGEGAVVGAGCIVRKNLEPWTVYVGDACLAIKKRDRVKVLELADKLMQEVGMI